ncbi:CoA transferase [Williamsia sterculiae]|uniref:CoA-transferase family III n=1 Tax=Williamsia sterculiae TaxID=1344003 RepID=A0A1N7H9X8_9NOCA|nr:CoA transferase [Williamsia sterculiae]SIS21694.1 CoA-transferase family III [Williamsia sterculiae]
MTTTALPPTSQILDDLALVLFGEGSVRSRVTTIGADPICPSPHRLADTSAAAMGAFALQVAGVDEDRGAAPQQITITATDALDQLRAALLAQINGVGPHLLSDDPTLLGLNDFYPTRDGWIFLLSTYPHLRAAVCTVLDCPPTASAMRVASQRWTGHELQERVVAAGGVAVVAHTASEWEQHPVARYLADRPVVEVERIGDGPLRPLPPLIESTTDPNGWRPLAGINMVDNTHVIAGPVAARLMSTFGADVVHTSRPDRPDPIGMLAVTGGGKRNAYADLRYPAGRAVFANLLASADVVLNSYRNVARFGLGAEQLAERHPGIVSADVHCWGIDGPWGDRGGFDQLACAATGFALDEGAVRGLPSGQPALPPTHLLNDYLAAYLVAAGAVAALRRRAVEGGSWRVRVNLARVCMWVRSYGLFAPDHVAGIEMPEPHIPCYTVVGPLGTLTEPGIPVTFSGRATPTPAAPTLLGTAQATFADITA